MCITVTGDSTLVRSDDFDENSVLIRVAVRMDTSASGAHTLSFSLATSSATTIDNDITVTAVEMDTVSPAPTVRQRFYVYFL